MVSHPARLAADLRASEVADAIGLNYRYSRAMLWQILHGRIKPPPTSERLNQCFVFGRWAEPWSRAAYRHVFGSVRNSHTYIEPFYGYTIAVTPDAERECAVIEFKSKMRYSDMPSEPKPAHLAQLVMQMWATGMPYGDLMYYNVWNGKYVCFHCRWAGGIWGVDVSHWLREYFSYVDVPPRMKNGAAERRSLILLEGFWWNGKTRGAAGGPGGEDCTAIAGQDQPGPAGHGPENPAQ